MTQKDKLLQRVRNNPKGVRFEELDALLTQFGFERRQPKGGSSHYVYRHGATMITVARHKPFIHSQAVKDVVEMIDQLLDRSSQDQRT
jgi:predicted RNA binding protein YcfA (HicA-like mRNA interferase family)